MGVFSIPMTKGLPYEIFMRHLIFQMTERGQINKLLKKWEILKHDCGAIHRIGKPLSWQKLITVFIIVIMGISIALVTLFIEKIYHIYQQNTNPIYCLTVKEANLSKLQHILKKIDCNLKNDSTIEHSIIRALNQEMENYNYLLNDAKRQMFSK